jgi:hypothetical protein
MIRRLSFLFMFAMLLVFAPVCLHADTVILRSGASHTGTFAAPANGKISFTGLHGVQYQFPVRDVQTIVFTASSDTLTLRSGHSFTGHLTGLTSVSFSDAEGIQYQFPLSDVTSLVLSQAAPQVQNLPARMKQISAGTEITVRSVETIDSKHAAPGQVFRAEVRVPVLDANGNIAIPQGSPAELQITTDSGGGVAHASDLALAIAGVTVNGTTYDVVSSDVYEKGGEGIGANKRTAGFVGGGAALGTLMGALFGGGKGALIGGLAGTGAGAATQVMTRGKAIIIPAETVLTFRLEQPLVLRPR